MAYKIKRKIKGRCVIQGIQFDFNKVVTIPKKVYDYIMKGSFKDIFDVVEVDKPQVKQPSNTQIKKKVIKEDTKTNTKAE